MEMAGLDKIPASIIEDAEGSRKDAAWSRVEPLLAAQSTQEIIALAPVSLVGGRHLPIEKALAVLNAVYAAHRGNAAVLGPLGTAMDGASDIDLLNAPPPEDPLFSNVVGDLVELLETTRDPDERTWVLKGLLTSARMVLGGAYLCFLAWRLWRGASNAASEIAVQIGTPAVRTTARSFWFALSTQLSNPKTLLVIGGIFAALLPAQIPGWMYPAIPITQLFVEGCWYAFVAIAMSSSGPRRIYSRARGSIDRVAGCVLGALGLRLTFEGAKEAA
jgi:arginine exporter protein ArgO